MTVARNVSSSAWWPAPPALGEAWLDRVDDVSRELLGVHDLRGARLGDALARVSHAYTKDRHALEALQGDDDALCARLKFFLPRDLLKIHGPLTELQSVGALPARKRWRVLDLGAGLGTTSLGVSRFAALTGVAERLQVTAIDVDGQALSIFQALARRSDALPAVPIELVTHVADLRLPKTFEARLSAPYDLIVVGLALNELRPQGAEEDAGAAETAARLVQLASLLAPDGALVIVEPALRETSRYLHAVRDLLAARELAPWVFAPCLQRGPCPMRARPRDFCHERVPLQLPTRLAALAEHAGLRDTDLTYSYLTLHAARRSLRERHEGPMYRAVSGVLPSKGKLEVWLCGEQNAPRAMRLDRHESDDNAAFAALGRGALVRLSGEANASDRAATERVRVGPDTHVELISGWRPRD